MTIKITEEMNVQSEWYEDSKYQTLETLPAFLNHLMHDYEHDYGTIVHAIIAGTVATTRAMDADPQQGGVTGFQASCIMWGFIDKWMHYEQEQLRLLKLRDLLYPQYDYKFNTISSDTLAWLQTKAQEVIGSEHIIHPDIMDRCIAIVDGKLPMGFTFNS